MSVTHSFNQKYHSNHLLTHATILFARHFQIGTNLYASIGYTYRDSTASDGDEVDWFNGVLRKFYWHYDFISGGNDSFSRQCIDDTRNG